MKKLINFLLFYFGWYISVTFHNIYAAAIVISVALVSSIIMSYKYKEIIIIIGLAILGSLSDAIAYKFGIYSFTYSNKFLILDNVWLISLWILFLATFNGSLIFLKRAKLYTLSCIGFLGGVFSYFLAFKLGTINFPDTFLSLFYIGIIWSCVFPVLYKAYHRIL